MTAFPDLALSIRQPWAWAVVAGHKPIENRDWTNFNKALRFRGPAAIHASKGMTREEYESARDFMATLGILVPAPADLLRGGIIGSARVVDVVRKSNSRWFFGSVGLVLADPQPCDFTPAVGALGFFRWAPADPSIVPPPARWMSAAPLSSPTLFTGDQQ